MTGKLYSVTLKYELRHTHGELEPTIDEVQGQIERLVCEGDTIPVPVTKGQKFEGCRVSVDEVEVQEAVTR